MVDNVARIDKLREALALQGLSGALITDLVDVRYLSGFTGSSAALVLPVAGAGTLVTDGRYKDQASQQIQGANVHIASDPVAASAPLMSSPLESSSGAKPVIWGVQTDVLSVDQFNRLTDNCAVTLTSLGGAVKELRELKDPLEQEQLERACQISTDALEALLQGPIEGRTEREIARDLQFRMYDLGADEIAFDTIVAAGQNTAIPHHQPTGKRIERGEFLKIDFGAQVDGYHADCTRTVVIGSASTWQAEVYNVVRASQKAGVDAVRVGSPLTDPWDATIAVLEEAGWREYFTTGLGHGVGLQIHEDPFLGPKRHGKIKDCMTLTIEPGIYVPGSGGVRIEDTLVATEGAARILTVMTKDLVEI